MADAVAAGNLRPAGLPLPNPSQGGAVCRFLPAVCTVSKHLISFAKVTSSAQVNPKG